MLEAVPTNLFSTTVRLERDNKLVGEVSPSWWGEKARLELEDGTYQLYREGFASGVFLLEKDGSVIARATKPSVFAQKFDIELPNRHLELRRASLWSRGFNLFDGVKQVGSIYPQGFFRRRSIIDVPADLPLPIGVFVFWLVLVMWKRQRAAAS
jgi:hypothetical protein